MQIALVHRSMSTNDATESAPAPASQAVENKGGRVLASPLAKKLAKENSMKSLRCPLLLSNTNISHDVCTQVST